MKHGSLLVLFTMSIFSHLFGASDHEARKRKIEEHDALPPAQEALDRRARTEAFLRSHGVPINSYLPIREDSKSTHLRTPRQIAERLVACTVCAVAGETGDKALVDQVLTDFDARPLLSEREKHFLERDLKVQQERVQFSWRYERSWVLLWALGYVDRLSYPPAICDVPKLAKTLQGKSVDQLVKESHPRSQKEILDEADLIYRINWAVVDERVHKKIKVPDEIEKDVVVERHAALNWLINYMDQEWDDVTTDT